MASVAWLLLPAARLDKLVEENGPVERATDAGYWLVLLALWWYRRSVSLRRDWLAMVGCVAAFAAREADWHRVWTGTSVLKVSYYLGPAPWRHKLLAAAVVLLALSALGYMLWRFGWHCWREARKGAPVAVTMLVFAATMVVSKVLDRSVSVLSESAGVAVPYAVAVLVRANEECLELGLPMLLLLALAQHVWMLQHSLVARPGSDSLQRASRL